MPDKWRIRARIAVALAAALLFAGFDVSAALAQSANCSRLYATLQALNRDGDFSAADQNNDNLRALQADERDAESAYIRTGCQSDQQQGYPQTAQCRALGRQILQQRAQIQRMSQSAANGNAVSQQREQVLQQIARFGCNQQGSQPRFFGDNAPDQSQQAQQPPPRHRNFLEELFGGSRDQDNTDDTGYGDNGQYNGQDQVEDPAATQQQPSQYTIRTVCVRLSDGYYWPISYSTTHDYIAQDAQTCLAECPDQQVDLYYYSNPGQEPEQMIDQTGKAYTSLPTAFAYRQNFDLTNTCKPQVTGGQISMTDLGGGQSRAMVSYGGETFPLPIRDPRATEAATTVAAAEVIDIPLPRPRPDAKTAQAPSTPPAADPVISVKSRIVKVGDKIVRVVGPDTPYAPATSTGNSG